MNNNVKIVASPFLLNPNTKNLVHSDSSGLTVSEDTIIQYQIPSGTTLAFGGSKPMQKFYKHRAMDDGTTPAVVSGILRLYKVTPDEETVRQLIGTYSTDQTDNVYDKNKLPDIGAEALRTIKTDEWLIVTFKLAKADVNTGADVGYKATNSSFRIEMSKLTAVSL